MKRGGYAGRGSCILELFLRLYKDVIESSTQIKTSIQRRVVTYIAYIYVITHIHNKENHFKIHLYLQREKETRNCFQMYLDLEKKYLEIGSCTCDYIQLYIFIT